MILTGEHDGKDIPCGAHRVGTRQHSEANANWSAGLETAQEGWLFIASRREGTLMEAAGQMRSKLSSCATKRFKRAVIYPWLASP